MDDPCICDSGNILAVRPPRLTEKIICIPVVYDETSRATLSSKIAAKGVLSRYQCSLVKGSVSLLKYSNIA